MALGSALSQCAILVCVVHTSLQLTHFWRWNSHILFRFLFFFSLASSFFSFLLFPRPRAALSSSHTLFSSLALSIPGGLFFFSPLPSFLVLFSVICFSFFNYSFSLSLSPALPYHTSCLLRVSPWTQSKSRRRELRR
ncbi:hypothetical protein F4802DRAFT_568613 [Xylaria palmicola]|nr:hypothetical protein F4802DRAFT_568613 [Xylaria palmicola]